MSDQITNSLPWRVNEIDSVRLGSLTLDRDDLKKLPSEDLIGLKEVYARALNSPPGRSLMGEPGSVDKPSFKLEFSDAKGLILSSNGGRVQIASAQEIFTEPSFKDFFTGKTPFIRQWQSVQRHALRRGVGRVGEMSPVQIERAERIQRVFAKAQKERDEAALKKEPKTGLQHFWSKTPERIAKTADVLAVFRNSLTLAATSSSVALETAKRMNMAVGVMGSIGGALAVGGGGFILRDAVQSGAAAYRHGDVEGGVLSAGNCAVGANLAFVGASMMAVNISTVAHSAAATGTALTVLSGAGFIFYSILAIVGLTGVATSGNFRSKMNTILEQEGVSEKDKLYEALSWMRDHTTLSEFEEMEISAKARASGKDPAAELQRELEKKWDQFARRSSEPACQALRDQATPEMMQRLKAGDPKALTEAHAIIAAVSRENFNTLVKNVMLVIISLLGIASFIAGVILAAPLSALLFAIGASFWVMIDARFIHTPTSRFCWYIRNRMYPEWNFDVQGKVCPSKLPTSSITFAPRRGSQSIPSTLTDETFKRSSGLFRRSPGPMLEPSRFSTSSPISKSGAMPPHRFAESSSPSKFSSAS
jgi:hypothetical protein